MCYNREEVGEKMRLKHIKGAEEKIKTSPYFIEQPEQYRGSWNQLFKNNQPIFIEIGSGKGNFIIENAKQHPNYNYIGIDKYPSVLLKATEKLTTLDLPNLKLLVLDAARIEQVFDHEIDTVFLNFSDPWPKVRHAKRRLTSPEFLERYEPLFQGNAHIEMKTDNRSLMEYSIMTFTNHGYHIKKINLNLYEQPEEQNIPTEYELKFSSRGFPIYKIEVEKMTNKLNNIHKTTKKTVSKSAIV